MEVKTRIGDKETFVQVSGIEEFFLDNPARVSELARRALSWEVAGTARAAKSPSVAIEKLGNKFPGLKFTVLDSSLLEEVKNLSPEQLARLLNLAKQSPSEETSGDYDPREDVEG